MTKESKPTLGKVKVPTRIGSLIENIINRFRTFQTIELEEYSDEWFRLEMYKRNPRGTICEVHRKLYKNIMKIEDRNIKESMIEDLKRAYIFGQKMDNKLKEYRVFMND